MDSQKINHLSDQVTGQVLEHFDQLDLPFDMAMRCGILIFVAAVAAQMKVDPVMARKHLSRYAELLQLLVWAPDAEGVTRIAAENTTRWDQ